MERIIVYGYRAARIAAAEEEIAALEAELALPEIASDYKKAGELSRTVDEKRQALETLYQKWEEAQVRLDFSGNAVMLFSRKNGRLIGTGSVSFR